MRHTIGAVAILLCTAVQASSQQKDPALAPAFAAMESCAALAEVPDLAGAARKQAESAGAAAEELFRTAVKQQPGSADAHYGLASVISRCRIPFAGMTTILGLVEQSIGEAETALEIQPTHWGARFMLAMNYFHMPSFLGKTNDAIRELEKLVAQQSSATSPPNFALPYVFLGDAYQRSGRGADASRIWREGATLFPEDAQLKTRAAKADTSAATAVTASELPPVVALAPLHVEVGAQQLDDARSGTALRRMDVYLMPGGTGEMMQALQALPGVTRASEGADMYVRGGDPAETPVFVDGGRIAFPGRWETLNGTVMGVLEASVLSKAYFSAGGFSARYGDALSGVVDVETRGRPEARAWRAGANFVQAGASIFEPIGERAGAWLTGGATNTKLLTVMNGDTDIYPEAPKSFHAIGGASFSPAHGVELRSMGIAMRDMATRTVNAGSYRGDFASEGTTLHAALSGRALRSDGRTGVEMSMAASQRENGFTLGILDRARTDRTVNGRMDAEYAGDATRLRGGFELAAMDARSTGRVPTTPNLAEGSPFQQLGVETIGTKHIGGYVEAEHVPMEGLSFVAGIRADRLPGEEDDVTVDPRLAAAYTSGDWTLRAGAGIYHQGSWRRAYRLPEGGAPSGTPREARHLIIGAERGGEPSLRMEAYIKTYGAYVPAGSGPQTVAGVSNGLDMIVRWSKQSRLNGWLTYSALDASVDLADGSTTRAPYDVTHTFTAVGRLALTDDWELGSTVRYATGKPFTPVMGSENGNAETPPTPLYGVANGERLPELQRLDARLTRYVRGDRALAVLYVEMLNLLGRRNVLAYSYDATWTQRSPVDAFYAHRTFVVGAEISH